MAVVERFKQEPMYGLSAGTKKVAVVAGGRCGEVAVSEGSTVFVSEFIEYAWFATTSQGGHVGGQYKKIFLEEFT